MPVITHNKQAAGPENPSHFRLDRTSDGVRAFVKDRGHEDLVYACAFRLRRLSEVPYELGIGVAIDPTADLARTHSVYPGAIRCGASIASDRNS
jgi:hypothetical protein